MADGDFTLTKDWNARPGWGGLKKAYFTFTATGDYVTDGYAVHLQNYNMGTIRHVGLPPTIGGYVPVYNYTTNHLLFYVGDNDNVGDAPLIEVANSVTPASTLTCKIVVEGTGV